LAAQRERAVDGRAADAQKGSDGWRGFALLNQLPGEGNLLRREFRLASEFHAPELRGLNSGVSALGDEATCL
jgi:hypothetical protein